MKTEIDKFKEVWCFDFEFNAGPGERPIVVCLVAKELKTGIEIRLWRDQLTSKPPYPVGKDQLFVAYYASAEVGCHLALGWPVPVNLLDLYVEHRNNFNGLENGTGFGLLDAMQSYGLSVDEGAQAHKDRMRMLALQGHWDETERSELVDYCASDVYALERLLPSMLPNIHLQQALLRGRYMVSLAKMEHAGIPMDVALVAKIKSRRLLLQQQLIAVIDKDYGVYEGTTFKTGRFTNYISRTGISWPQSESGKFLLDDDTFKLMAGRYPVLQPLRELRKTVTQLRELKLPVGADGRNRCMLSAFKSKTGRNQPSNSQFIFGACAWMRGMIKPNEGYAIAYIDYSQQEFGIAAALSGDSLMWEAYQSGDPYLEFAKQAGAVPKDATKQSHKAEREQFKSCVLAVQYGMGAESLALRIGQSKARAEELLKLHRATYKRYWEWSDGVVEHALQKNRLWTVFGWYIRFYLTQPNTRSIANFPMQANGAEILRLSCCLVSEAGIQICAPIHDAILIESKDDQIEADVELAQHLMADASELVLGKGYRLRSDAKIVRFPDRYMDERGADMFEKVFELLNQIED